MLHAKRKLCDPGYGELPVVFEDIATAAFRIKGGVKITECLYSDTISHETGCEIYFKHDHRQFTGSFKERGALNALKLLSKEQQTKGVIAASAGNHALGLAYHGKRLNIPVTVVMPQIAPMTKISKCKNLGAIVHIYGNNIGESKEYAQKLCDEQELTYINGYDDPGIIAGAGTMGLEIVDQMQEFDAIVIPIGGAGLIAGVSLAVKMIRPETLVIGVEPMNCPSFSEALKYGKPIKVDSSPTLADGLAVPEVGETSFKVASKFVDKVVKVTEKFVALAVLRMVELEKTVVEGGGVAGLAALLQGCLPELKGKKVVVPLCGGNIDITTLGRVIDRGLAADGRLFQFVCSISDRPGGLATFTKLIANESGSVKDIIHERAFMVEHNINIIRIRCVVETINLSHAHAIIKRLKDEGYTIDEIHPPALASQLNSN